MPDSVTAHDRGASSGDGLTMRPEFCDTRLGRIAEWQTRYIAEKKYPGSMVLLHCGDREVYFNAAGLRSVEENKPYTRDTIVRLFSMTKPVTSVAVMMLAERGLVHLDMPVSAFIPSFAGAHALVEGATRIDQTRPCPTPTLHHLLTHTSGMSYPFNPGILPRAMGEGKIMFGPRQGSLADAVEAVAKLPLAFRPGTRWEYSVAIDILGRVAEIVSGKSLGDFFAENIFAPLGMTETGFSVPANEDTLGRFASLYTPLEGDPMDINSLKVSKNPLNLVEDAAKSAYTEASLHSGGGGLVGTIDDYMRFADMLRRGGAAEDGTRLLSPKTLSFMMRNHLPGEIASMGPESFAEMPMEGTGFGLGGSVVLDPARARVPGSVGDFGWGGMASTVFWVDRALDVSAVFFTQLTPSSSYPSRPQLKALVHGAMVA